MLKRTLLAFALFFMVSSPTHAEDFSTMSPAVKIISHKKLFTDNVVAFGSGSGTVITPDGLIVTNHHVIFDESEFEPLDAFEICITFDVQREPVCQYTARLLAHDQDFDIALLKLNRSDVFGNTVPSSLKHLSIQNLATPRESEHIQVVGYPGSGGETVTITQGQISGFEEFNGYQYFKTDTDFDHGSSGGTALDSEGNFIGIPTYIRSIAETVGYFLDLREARGWINSHSTDRPVVKLKAEAALAREMQRFKQANDTLRYTQDHYPYLGVTLPNGWEFLEINHDSFFASQKNQSRPVGVSVFTSNFQFPIDQGYLDKLNEELEYIKETYPDYKREDTTFAGQDAWKISYTSIANRNTTYYIPYGYALVGVSYSVDLDEAEAQEADLKPALDSFRFAESPQNDPGLLDTVRFSEPAFEMTAYGDWRLQKNESKQPMSLLVDGVEKGNFEGTLSVHYDQVTKDVRHLSAEDRLEDILNSLGGRKLVYKNDKVSLAGLKGFLYTYEYEGQKYQEIRKHMTLVVRDGDYEFTISYDDLTEDFDRNLPALRKMLDSFAFEGESNATDTLTSYGTLGHTFSDIQFHSYAAAISDLADKGIVNGYPDGSFRPEEPVSRIDALQIILDSKNHLEQERGLGKEVDFENFVEKKGELLDIGKNDPFSAYVHYALEEEILSGYGDRRFRPRQSVTLAEALKLILHTYEVPVWAGETNPWFKKYMDKGFELRLIPYGMYNPHQILTRAELTHLVSTVYRHAKN